MYTIHAEITIAAPAEAVFRAVSDHENFLSGTVGTCRLTREGSPERNGLGATREVRTPSLTFSEEVVLFEPPRRFDYYVLQITGNRGRPWPFRHDRGQLVFAPAAGGTFVTWDSTFSISLPVLGWFLERIAGRKMQAIFQQLLRRSKSQLESSPTGEHYAAESSLR